ncbi:hypothetical protein Tco_1261735 [Tanacetum coccineum]
MSNSATLIITNFFIIKDTQGQTKKCSPRRLLALEAFSRRLIELMKKRRLQAFETNLQNSESKDEGSRSRSQSMNEQSHYKQEKMKTRPMKAKLKSQIKITSNGITLEIATDGFRAYWDESSRVIASKGDLRGYWDKISSSGDFLTTFLSYIQIRDPLRRLCHRLIAHTIAGRGQAPDKVTRTDQYFLRSMDREVVNLPYLLGHYLFSDAEGRKQGAQMSRGHFIARLVNHFGMLIEETLHGAIVVVRELTGLDLDELSRLHICERMVNTRAKKLGLAPGD